MTGDDLKFFRVQAGLTQQQVADRAGWVYKATVSSLEKRAIVPVGSADKYLAAVRELLEVDRKSA